MMNIIVGTENKDKIAGARAAFIDLMFNDIEIVGLPVPSGIPKQPKNESENRAGAFNRAYKLFRDFTKYDYYVGIESGLKPSEEHKGLFVMRDWVCIIDTFGRRAEGSGGGNYLPKSVCDLIVGGVSLSKAMRQVFPDYTDEGGSLAYLTKRAVSRKEEVKQVVVRAMIPFLYPKEYASYFESNICKR